MGMYLKYCLPVLHWLTLSILWNSAQLDVDCRRSTRLFRVYTWVCAHYITHESALEIWRNYNILSTFLCDIMFLHQVILFATESDCLTTILHARQNEHVVNIHFRKLHHIRIRLVSRLCCCCFDYFSYCCCHQHSIQIVHTNLWYHTS